MPYERNNETQQALSQEIKALKGHCVEACHIIENAPLEPLRNKDVTEKALDYVEGLRTDIQNSNTSIPTDDNLLTSQFLNEMKDKTVQVEELTAFCRGAIYDVDTEINRLNSQIKIAEEAKCGPRSHMSDVRPEHLQRAKEKFHLLKNELHGLIGSLFPDNAEAIKDVLGQLMSEKLKAGSNGYIQITTENFCLIEILRERNIVSVNPYNNTEIKLAY